MDVYKHFSQFFHFKFKSMYDINDQMAMQKIQPMLYLTETFHDILLIPKKFTQ